jgi:hypothetical protein
MSHSHLPVSVQAEKRSMRHKGPIKGLPLALAQVSSAETDKVCTQWPVL